MSKTKKKTLPYASTTISPDDTLINIKQLFRKYGIQDIQESTISGNTTLRFVYHAESRDATFEIKPPTIMDLKKTWNPKLGRYETVNVPMIAQAWRLVYWYLQIKLKAIDYGLVSMEREFLNQMLGYQKDEKGNIVKEIQIGDYLMEKLEHDKGQLKLEAPKPEEPKAVEAEFRVKEEKTG